MFQSPVIFDQVELACIRIVYVSPEDIYLVEDIVIYGKFVVLHG